MATWLLVGAAFAAALWTLVLLVPWKPHLTRERIEPAAHPADLHDVAVLIPARNESEHIARVLKSLTSQGPGLAVWVVDDESTDGTGALCQALRRELAAPVTQCEPNSAAEPSYPLEIHLIAGAPLPPGWAGKLWALQQGLAHIDRRHVLLLDADIELAPRLIPALLARADAAGASLVSAMATLNCCHFWERLLVPAFIFFFKLLYPFALVETNRRSGAAGGCMLVETAALRSIDGYAGLRDALIDDCTLAARLRDRGYRLSLGMSRSVRSLREYPRLDEFWTMVSRTAFTQLGYSWWLLLSTELVMLVVFVVPLLAIVLAPSGWTIALGVAALVLMGAAYWPVVRFYHRPMIWVGTLPLAGSLFMAMTVSSAINYARGTRATWKDRSYETGTE